MAGAIGGATPTSASGDHGPRWINAARVGVSPANTAAANRVALQAIIDGIEQTSGRHYTVFLPAGTYSFDRPIFNDRLNISLAGDGMDLTRLQFTLDGIVAGIPRRVVGTGTTPLPTLDHFPDLFGVLDTSAVTGTRQKWGIRTKADHHLACMAGAFDSGWGADYYRTVPALTIDAAIDFSHAGTNPSFPASGVLFGVSSEGIASPWSVHVASNQFRVMFRTVDPTQGPMGGVDRTFYFGNTFLANNPGFCRLTVQIDLATATVAAWINGVQQAIAIFNTGAGWTSGLSFVSNYAAPFMLGANSGTTSVVSDAGLATLDTTFAGLKVSAAAVYTVGSTGSAQVRADAAPITDANRYITASSTTIGLMNITADPATTACVDRLVILGRGQGGTTTPAAAYFLDNVGHAGGNPYCVPGSVRDLAITTNGASGTAYINGSTYNADIRDCLLGGGQRGFASFNTGANYPINIRDCQVSGNDTPFYFHSSWARNIIQGCQTIGNHRTTLRGTKSWPKVKDTFVTNGGGQPEFLVQMFKGYFELENVSWDNENFYNGLGTKACFYATAWNSNPIDGIIRVVNSTPTRVYPGSPIFYLDSAGDEDGSWFFPATVDISGLLIYDSVPQTVIQTDGVRWKGTIKAVGEIRNPTWVENLAADGLGAVVSHHDNFTGPPRDGTWTQNCHVLEALNPTVGQFTEWRCRASGSYGTATPPVWQGFDPLDDGLSLAAYIHDHSYWSAGGAMGAWSNAALAYAMNALFTGSSMPATGGLLAGLGSFGSVRYRPYETPVANGYARVSLGSGVFGTSSSGSVSNAQAITFAAATGNWQVYPSPEGVVNTLLIMDASGNLLASMDIPPITVTNGVTPSFGIGTVSAHPAASSGQGWLETSVHDMVANYWLHGTAMTIPTLYLALSTATISPGSSPTEPAGGGYARVATAHADWAAIPWATFALPGPTGQSCTIKNANALAFPAPSGDWGTIQSVYLMTASSGGTVFGKANLTIPRTIANGSGARSFPVAGLRICRS